MTSLQAPQHVPSTTKISLLVRSEEVQSASFPGNIDRVNTFFRRTSSRALRAASAARLACSALASIAENAAGLHASHSPSSCVSRVNQASKQSIGRTIIVPHAQGSHNPTRCGCTLMPPLPLPWAYDHQAARIHGTCSGQCCTYLYNSAFNCFPNFGIPEPLLRLALKLWVCQLH
jgi:hypothetical protein